MRSHLLEFGERPRKPGTRFFSAARLLLVLTLFAAPFPYGSVYTWAWTSLTVMMLLVVALWMLGSLRAGTLRLGFSPLYLPMLLFVALVLAQLAFHLTLTPLDTKTSLLQIAMYFVLFFVVIQLFWDSPEKAWRRVGFAVLVFGFLFSFLAILQFLWNPARIVWLGRDVGSPFGPYIDRDHYAGLMEMIGPFAAGYVLSRPRRDPLNGVLWAAVLVPVVSLLLTGSRGGFVAMLAEVAILVWILIRRNPLPGGQRRIVATGLALVAGAALFFWLVPSIVLSKLGAFNSYVPEVHGGSRWLLWKDSVGILRDHRWVGAGLGSFVTVYTLYQTVPLDLITQHAHNDYVEALAESGLVGGILVVLALIMFLRITIRNVAGRSASEREWIQMGAAIACYGLLVHSFVDFNLHIPANAIWFVFCAGIASLTRRTPPKAQAPSWSYADDKSL